MVQEETYFQRRAICEAAAASHAAPGSVDQKAKVCALDLVRAVQSRGGVCELGGTVDELPRRLRELCSREDLLLILGAGDIDKVVEEVVAVL